MVYALFEIKKLWHKFLVAPLIYCYGMRLGLLIDKINVNRYID